MWKNTFFLFCIVLLALAVRIYQLTEIPPSLSWDEASLGYNAYTIAHTLRDEHGEFLPLSRFIAFGDYKPPGYIYVTAPIVFLFGLNEFTVRLPSMAAGVLTVIITYLLAHELFSNRKIAYIASFFIAISPWAIHFSRAAFESNLAMFFNLLGVYLFILSRRRGSAIVLSYIFFLFSFYTFNANRIIAPLLLFSLHLIYFKNSLKNMYWIIISVVVSLILLYPSFGFMKDRESMLRFQEVSIFNNLVPIEISNARIDTDGGSLWSRIIHNRRWLFLDDYLKHYFDNLTGRFLFTHGDGNPRLSMQEMGVLYILDLPLLILGIFYFVKNREKSLLPIFLWLIIAPIPAGTARETPHALRILTILPTLQIIFAYGLYYTLHSLKKLHGLSVNVISLLVSILYMIFSFYYFHNYHIHYPYKWSGEWQYGYKEMVSYVSSVNNQYDQIYITSALGRPYIFFAFYEKYPQDLFLSEREANRDWFGFWNVNALGKYKFTSDNLDQATGKLLLVTTPRDFPNDFRKVKTIKNLADDDVFVIGEKK